MKGFSIGMQRRLKGQAGGPVQLADNNALGAIDYKGALRSHQGQFPHEHLLLFDGSFLLELESDVQGRAIGQALPQTFQPVHFGFSYFIGMKIQNALSIVAFDGKHFRENGLQPQVFPLRGSDTGLEKIPVRVGLQFDQIGRGDYFFDLAGIDSLTCSR